MLLMFRYFSPLLLARRFRFTLTACYIRDIAIATCYYAAAADSHMPLLLFAYERRVTC